MGRIILATLSFLLLGPVLAGQTVIPNYEKARDDFFWPKLYVLGGWTLYCAAPFGAGKDSRGLQVEHVYPAAWMAEHLHCGSRTQCRQTSEAFNFMEADLNNLFPALPWANSTRSDHSFGLLAGEKHFFENCDFDVGIAASDGKTLIEPREDARGEIARAMFYMHQEYGLPIKPALGQLLKQWNQADPPSWDEKRRNKKTKELQGTKNPFIDNPGLADSLNFSP